MILKNASIRSLGVYCTFIFYTQSQFLLSIKKRGISTASCLTYGRLSVCFNVDVSLL